MYPGVGPYEDTNEIIMELEHCLQGGAIGCVWCRGYDPERYNDLFADLHSMHWALCHLNLPLHVPSQDICDVQFRGFEAGIKIIHFDYFTRLYEQWVRNEWKEVAGNYAGICLEGQTKTKKAFVWIVHANRCSNTLTPGKEEVIRLHSTSLLLS